MHNRYHRDGTGAVVFRHLLLERHSLRFRFILFLNREKGGCDCDNDFGFGPSRVPVGAVRVFFMKRIMLSVSETVCAIYISDEGVLPVT